MTDIQLKNPCPFCGKQLKIVERESWPDYDNPTTYYEPECETADCTVNDFEGYYGTPEEAAEAWDRRASPWRTDPPPKDGSEILGMFRNGPRVVFWDCWDVGGDYDSPPDGTECAWCYAGDEVIYEMDEPIKWMEVPK